MTAPILRIENISKRYGKKDVLKGASLDVNKGDLKILIGPSGASTSSSNPMRDGSGWTNGRFITQTSVTSAPTARRWE
jgi:ABC-type lipopolysaccharide export system ATPase subunit